MFRRKSDASSRSNSTSLGSKFSLTKGSSASIAESSLSSKISIFSTDRQSCSTLNLNGLDLSSMRLLPKRKTKASISLCILQNPTTLEQVVSKKLEKLNKLDDRNKMAPLHYAAMYADFNVMQTFVNAAGELLDFNLKDGNGRTAIMHACLSNQLDTIRMLSEKSKCVIDNADKFGYTCIHYAIAVGDTAVVQTVLENSMHLNSLCNGESYLHVALRLNKPDVAMVLIQKDLDVNIRDTFEKTPLHLACELELESICKELLNHGADPELEDMDGKLPADYLTTNAMLIDLLKTAKLSPGLQEIENTPQEAPPAAPSLSSFAPETAEPPPNAVHEQPSGLSGKEETKSTDFDFDVSEESIPEDISIEEDLPLPSDDEDGTQSPFGAKTMAFSGVAMGPDTFSRVRSASQVAALNPLKKEEEVQLAQEDEKELSQVSNLFLHDQSERKVDTRTATDEDDELSEIDIASLGDKLNSSFGLEPVQSSAGNLNQSQGPTYGSSKENLDEQDRGIAEQENAMKNPDEPLFQHHSEEPIERRSQTIQSSHIIPDVSIPVESQNEKIKPIGQLSKSLGGLGETSETKVPTDKVETVTEKKLSASTPRLESIQLKPLASRPSPMQGKKGIFLAPIRGARPPPAQTTEPLSASRDVDKPNGEIPENADSIAEPQKTSRSSNLGISEAHLSAEELSTVLKRSVPSSLSANPKENERVPKNSTSHVTETSRSLEKNTSPHTSSLQIISHTSSHHLDVSTTQPDLVPILLGPPPPDSAISPEKTQEVTSSSKLENLEQWELVEEDNGDGENDEGVEAISPEEIVSLLEEITSQSPASTGLGALTDSNDSPVQIEAPVVKSVESISGSMGFAVPSIGGRKTSDAHSLNKGSRSGSPVALETTSKVVSVSGISLQENNIKDIGSSEEPEASSALGNVLQTNSDEMERLPHESADLENEEVSTVDSEILEAMTSFESPTADTFGLGEIQVSPPILPVSNMNMYAAKDAMEQREQTSKQNLARSTNLLEAVASSYRVSSVESHTDSKKLLELDQELVSAKEYIATLEIQLAEQQQVNSDTLMALRKVEESSHQAELLSESRLLEIQDLHTKIAASHEDAEAFRGQLAYTTKLQSELNLLLTKHHDQEVDLHTLQQDHEKVVKEHSDKVQEQRELQQEMSELEQVVQTLKNEMRDLEDRLQQSEKDLEAANVCLHNITEKEHIQTFASTKQSSDYARLNTEHDRLLARCNDLEERLRQSEKDLELANACVYDITEKEHAQTLASTKQSTDYARLSTEYELLLAQCKDLEVKLQQSEKDLEVANACVHDITEKERIQILASTQQSSDYARLSTEHEILLAQCQRLEEKLQQSEKDLEAANTCMHDITEREHTQTLVSTKQSSDHAQLRKEHEILLARFADNEQTLSETLVEVTQLRSNYLKLVSENEELQLKHTRLQEQYQDLEAECQTAQRALAAAKEQISELLAGHDANQVQFERVKSDFEAQISSLRAQLEKKRVLEEESGILKQERDKHLTSLTSQKENQRQLQLAIEDLQQALDEKKEELVKLEGRNAHLQEKVKQVQSKCQEQALRLEQADANAQQMESLHQSLKKTADLYHLKTEQLNMGKLEQEDAIQQLQQKVHALEVNLMQERQNTAHHQSEYHALQAKLQENELHSASEATHSYARETELIQQKKALKLDLIAKENDVTQLNKKLEDQHVLIKKLQKDLEAAQSATMVQSHHQWQEMQARLHRSQLQVAQLEGQVETLQLKIAMKDDLVRDAMAQESELKEHRQQLRTQLKTMEQSLLDTQSQYLDQCRATRDAEEERADLRTKLFEQKVTVSPKPDEPKGSTDASEKVILDKIGHLESKIRKLVTKSSTATTPPLPKTYPVPPPNLSIPSAKGLAETISKLKRQNMMLDAKLSGMSKKDAYGSGWKV